MRNILDAGPLIAALNRQDEHNKWASETLAQIGPPFYSCAEALAEAAAMTGQPVAIVEMVESGDIIPDFNLKEQAAGVLSLLNKYSDRHMDLADACIVRMTELIRDCRVITVDRTDFKVYRRNGRGLIPVIAPPAKS
jgi:predicted nucleic acid-binding protein